MISAILLAAGNGVRAWPFCGVRQKVTVPILNTPIVRRLALDLQALGVREIVTVIGHRGESVRACLSDLEGVRFVEQKTLKGPVDAALLGLDVLSAERSLICHADMVTTRDTLKAVLDDAASAHSDALLLATPAPPGSGSYVAIEAEGDLLKRVSIAKGRGHRSFAGITAGSTDALRRYFLRDPGIVSNSGVGAMPPTEGTLAFAFDHMARDGIEVRVLSAPDPVVDVDRPWDIVEANRIALAHDLAELDRTTIGDGASIHDGADIAEGAKIVLESGARIGKGVQVKGSLFVGAGAQLLNGAILGANAFVGARSICRDYAQLSSGSVLGADCLVGHGAEFAGVAFDKVYLYHYCCISALIGCNVDVGAATVCGTWRFDDGVKTQTVHGHKELPPYHGQLTYLGDYSRTGVNVVFMPGVKVGYYACVGAGALIYDDVPERTLLLPKQEHTLRPWGPEKYGW